MIRFIRAWMAVMLALGTFCPVKAATNSMDQVVVDQNATMQKRNALLNRHLASIKATDPELYKELVVLRDKDPEKFSERMHALHKKHMSEHGGMAKGFSEEQVQKGLEKIKEKDAAAYLELLDLKEKEPAQFRVKFMEYAKKYGSHEKGSGQKKKK